MCTAPPASSSSGSAASMASPSATARRAVSSRTTRSPMFAPAEHAEIREAIRRYAREQLWPNAARWDREREFPREALKGLAAMGLYGIAIPEEWGGAGLDYIAMAIASEEISAGDCATATIVAVNNLVAGILNGYGNTGQKEKYLKPLARGDMLGA